MSTVHIIGAGLAGLSAAVRLVDRGHAVKVYEGAGHAGGRCRSFVDKHLDHLIDNGNHLLMSGNRSALAYLEEIGSRNSLLESDRAAYPFIDLKTGARWTVEPSAGMVPTWILRARTRVPGTRMRDYLMSLPILWAGRDRTVADAIPTNGALFERFWEPLTIAALNAKPERGAARLLQSVLRETFLKGEAACRPMIARDGLGPSFIDPAVALLESRDAPVVYNRRLRGVGFDGTQVKSLDFGADSVAVNAGDAVVLALPAFRIAQILPEFEPPGDGETIVNAHFRMRDPVEPPFAGPVIGLINAVTDWIFVRGTIISLTISAAGDIAENDTDTLTEKLWQETAQALDLQNVRYQAARIIKEKRATFDQSPAGVAKRKPARTTYDNLFLAGDWTDTGLPATIESAIRSGHNAAAEIVAWQSRQPHRAKQA